MVLCALVLLGAGCGSSAPGGSPGAAGTSGGAGNGVAGSGAAGAGGATAVALPLVVDDHSGPSSCYGKAATAGAVDQSPNAADCVPPASGAAGKCWRIDYHPTGGTDAFGGCQWSLDPAATAALTIEPGATKAVFTAAGLAGGEVINFFAGGTPSDRASFVAQKTTLTTTMTRYEIAIPDLSAKTEVHVPFGYTIVDGDNAAASLSFFVTGIEWVK
jgi:hypothetical protein